MPRQRSARHASLRASALACVLLLAACSSGGGPQSPSRTTSGTSPSPSVASTPTPTETSTETPTKPAATPSSKPPAEPPVRPPTRTTPPTLAGWTLEQKVGQLFMVGVDVHNLGHDAYNAIRDRHVGNVFLAGRTDAGRQPVHNLVAWFTDLVSAETTHGTPLFVATDQEGGKVQVLRGPGFSDLPNALDQAILPPATLQSNARTWGTELALAGVNLDLAPVMDLVPSSASAPKNPPIGALRRNYGYTLDSVTSHANAFSAGLESAGVEVSIKHFPGLGRVTANTDTAAGVTDTVTTRDGSSVQAFRSGIKAGAAVVMTSTAVYTRIDPGVPAAFSPVIVGDVLRGDLGFTGMVISDDLSAATQVLAWSPAQRAIKTIKAGGDVVLVSRDPTVAPQMVDVVVALARANPEFAKKVDAAALRVLAAKRPLAR